MIDVHLIVQDQRVVALAPVVADARFPVGDQRIDVQLREASGDGKARLSAADNEHGRLTVGIFCGGLAQIEPIRSAKIARIGLALRPGSSEPLLVSFDFVERRQQRPPLEGASVIGGEPQHAAAAPLCGFKAEDRFDRVDAGAPDVARRGPTRV